MTILSSNALSSKTPSLKTLSSKTIKWSRVKRHHAGERRGVVLLLIVSLLALFSLVAITYVISAGQHKNAARALAEQERTGDDPKDDIDKMFNELMVGTMDLREFDDRIKRGLPRSPIEGHGLLIDMYGYTGLGGTVNTVDKIAGGQMIKLFLTSSGVTTFNQLGNSGGCVITMLDGPAVGLSTHIVWQRATPDSASGGAEVRAVAFSDGHKRDVLPQPGNRFWINGQAFSGIGSGFNGQNRRKMDGDKEVYFFPNSAFVGVNPYLTNVGGQRVIGDANEGHDAVDLDNMALAMMLPGGQVIPSFHRPALIQLTATRGDPNDLRKVMLRPNSVDHPNFTGSNPNFDPVKGPWDIDNNGDKFPDAVWIDPGFPTQTARDGRRFRKLFAITAIALDGGVPLNSSGTLAQLDARYDSPSQGVYAGGKRTANLPRGRAGGTGDIRLSKVIGGDARKIMVGDVGATDGRPYPGRYGRDGKPGRAGVQDPLSLIKHYNYPRNRRAFDQNGNIKPDFIPGDYVGPPDLSGGSTVGLDPRGQPFWRRWVEDGDTRIDNPYEMNLNRDSSHGHLRGNTIDAPFTAAEYERVLRQYDDDIRAIPPRLWELLSPASRKSVHEYTFGSFDLPVPNMALSSDLMSQGQRARHIVDLLVKRLQLGKTTDIEKMVRAYLPPEMLAGMKFDLNRPFGNGRDDLGSNRRRNGIVDEASSGSTYPGNLEVRPRRGIGEFVWDDALAGLPGQFWKIPFDFINDDPFLSPDARGRPPRSANGLRPEQRSREVYARQLYILMMLLKPRNAEIDMDAGIQGPNFNKRNERRNSELKTARALAQLAVNIVDYRDRDSIMTNFAYDPSPFDRDGWNPPTETRQGLTRPRFEVWGCERPELIITEVMAGHDMGTVDTDDDPSGKKTDSQDQPDRDFDQKYKPDGWLYVELYNPWSKNEPPPGDFYFDRRRNKWTNGVVLDQLAPGNAKPVWRLMMIDERTDLSSPDGVNYSPNRVRSCYFIDTAVQISADGSRNQFDYYRGSKQPIAPVEPGMFAVIGPRLIQPIGRRSGATDTSLNIQGTRRIEMHPSANADQSYIEVKDNLGAGSVEPTDRQIAKAVCVVVDGFRPLSLTDPPHGYPTSVKVGDTTHRLRRRGRRRDGSEFWTYSPPIDRPIDLTRNDQMRSGNHGDERKILSTPGTYSKFRNIHLQRLANPLLPFNEQTNPYRTIDSMAVDLTVYRGAEPFSKNEPNNSPKPIYFASRQRGGESNRRAGGLGPNNLWTQEDWWARVRGGRLEGVSPKFGTNHNFPFKLEHTLGYLNDTYGLPYLPGEAPTEEYIGAPKQKPFPWLTWGNSPFLSPMELMLVPRTRSSLLLRDYRMGSEANDPYTTASGPFPHLPNFFHSGSASSLQKPIGLNRLLDFVHVPSRFVGTETFGDPKEFSIRTQNGTLKTIEEDTIRGMGLRPPYNKLSHYRDPGRININMIFSQRVWEAVRNGFPGMSYNQMMSSRRGYGGAGGGLMEMEVTIPTRFANPFRGFGAAGMLPPAAEGIPPKRELDMGLLRRDITNPKKPLFGYVSREPHNDTFRNPYFKYQNLFRLSNLVTTRSNSYAIWITMGYFEVLPLTEQQKSNPMEKLIYPDGVQLGREVGEDGTSGGIKRHRAFYIIDRTIPVACQAGKVHNIHRAVLVNRLIE